MQTGYAISASVHGLLIAWVVLGDAFRSDPPAVEVTEVSVISSAEFAALLAPETEAVPAALPTDAGPAPAPEAAVPPVEESPESPVAAPPPAAAEPVPVPEQADEAVPLPSSRIAPEAVATPEPEARPDPIEQAARAPSPEQTEAEPEPDQRATAPEEAATEITTEAEEPASARMTSSLRPPARRPSPPARTAPAQTETPPPANDAIADALAAALSDTTAPDTAPTGPPLSAGQKDALRLAVQKCWNVGSLSTEALGTTVVLSVDMTRDGKPVQNSIRMVGSSGGSADAARQAYQAARRAILICGQSGFDLPPESYGRWSQIEMTFNPERMRIR